MASINLFNIKDIVFKYSNTLLNDSSIFSITVPVAANIVIYSIEYLSISL